MSKLGAAGMIRFLDQYETRKGNYTVDRNQWLTVPDVETLANQIQGAREDMDKERQKLDEAIETTLHGVFRKTVEAYKALEKIDEAMKTILQRLSPMPEQR